MFFVLWANNESLNDTLSTTVKTMPVLHGYSQQNNCQNELWSFMYRPYDTNEVLESYFTLCDMLTSSMS